jgi:hypothetical protein
LRSRGRESSAQVLDHPRPIPFSRKRGIETFALCQSISSGGFSASSASLGRVHPRLAPTHFALGASILLVRALAPHRRELFALPSPIAFVPITLAVIAHFAEHLKVAFL